MLRPCLSGISPLRSTLFAVGVWLYVSGTRATNRMGILGLWPFVGILTLAWLSGPFGPPPPNIEVVVLSALVIVPLIILGRGASTAVAYLS